MNRIKSATLSSSFSVLALGIEEIIVTSRKREESIFDIPVAVTAFSADDIQNMGLDNEFSRYPGQSGTLSLSYNREFGTDHEFFARGDYLYQSETWQTNANVSKTGAWGTVNLRVGIMTDGWRVGAYGSNVFDETGYSAFQNFPDLSFQTGGRQVSGRFCIRQRTPQCCPYSYNQRSNNTEPEVGNYSQYEFYHHMTVCARPHQTVCLHDLRV
jgi:outer membrane receptor protein involved in Fe transport